MWTEWWVVEQRGWVSEERSCLEENIPAEELLRLSAVVVVPLRSTVVAEGAATRWCWMIQTGFRGLSAGRSAAFARSAAVFARSALQHRSSDFICSGAVPAVRLRSLLPLE